MKKCFFLIVITLIILKFQIQAQSWVFPNFPPVARVYDFAAIDSTFFAASSGGVLISVDKGANWTQVNNGLADTSVISLAVIGTNLFAGTESGVFLSIDKGSNWSAANNGLTTTIFSLAVSGTNLFAGLTGGAYLSTDMGSSWIAINNGLPSARVTSFKFIGSNVFASTWEGVFISSNNGVDWTSASNGLANTLVRDLACCDTNIFAATNGGVFQSNDNGASWTSINYNLPSLTQSNTFTGVDVCGNYLFTSINNFGATVLPLDGKRWNDFYGPFLFVGGFKVLGDRLFEGSNLGGGICFTILPANITSAYDLKTIPLNFGLEQNYPNPFNPITTIMYSIPELSKVKLTLFNLLGEEIKTLVDEEQIPGNYKIEFNAKNIPSGVYFYQLKAGVFLQTKKMVLLK